MSGVRLRPARPADLAYVTTLERNDENRTQIGQWDDAEHLAAMAGEGGREHWIIERDGRAAGYLIAYDLRAAGAGIYVKRILVDDKEHGTGRAALAAFLAAALRDRAPEFVWLNVRDGNSRAQAVYRALGFSRHDPAPAEAARLDSAAEPPGDGAFRMRLEGTAIPA